MALLIYALLIAFVVGAFYFFQEDNVVKTKIDPSKLHFKKEIAAPKVELLRPTFKRPKETASSLKREKKKLVPHKMMSQAQIDEILKQDKETRKDPLTEAIYKKLPQSVEKKSAISPKDKLIKELYGSDYTLLSSKSKKYLKDNYEVMHAVTQNVLNRIGRVYIDPKFYYYDHNLIEFTLYPDGSISKVKMLKNAGFELLNKITKETIETAFKDYPPSEEPVLLRYKFLYD
ncbi:MAG: hypothetical protein OEW60_08580, partial [Thiovulaceae bacterium]|nr:hypothetical protein [Sulfurimonadaceae bacterium]